ncbi:MAG: glycosyltransferase family 4 protein [Acidobacteriia bacterium]|nr:glycosyltransferase family 4 protein [Terriglobia bacterium]
MKSICIVVQNVYDIDVRVRRKAEALVSAGYLVDVLALAPENGKRAYTLNGVNVYTISLGKKRGSLVRYFYEYAAFFLWTFMRLPFLMRRKHYAVIDVNTLPDFLIFAAIPARWMGAKLILDMHEITPEFYISKYGIAGNSWLIGLLKYLEKISFDCADYVITINEPILDLLVRRGLTRSKSVVVMNAVDDANFTSDVRLPAEEQGSSKFVMMYHGTLTRIYGLDIAVEAFSMAHIDMPGAEMWILGSGPEKSVLEELAEQRGLASKVRLVGRVPAEDIPSWLNKCDVGLLPIRRDVFLDFAFPNKLPEFIIMGKAVLMSRLAAIRHYFSDDALAFSEPNDAADLAKQMVRLYEDRPLRARLATKAKQEYEPIRWELMKQRYLKLIEGTEGSISAVVQRPNLTIKKAEAIEQSRESAEGSNP